MADNGAFRVNHMEARGGNIQFNVAGDVVVGHGEASGNFQVHAHDTPSRVQFDSLVAGLSVDIETGASATLGDVSSGSSTSIVAQSIAFNALNAGTTVALTANGTIAGAEGIDGATVIAGGDINMTGNSIAITNALTGDANFAANASGGTIAIDNAEVAGNISVTAAGNLTGAYTAGGETSV